MPKIEWALHKQPENPQLYTLSMRNVRKDEAARLLMTFAEIQRERGEANPPTPELK